MPYFITLVYILLIFLAYLIQTAPLDLLSDPSGVRPNLLYNLLFLGFIYFEKTKMLFFILLVVLLLESGSLVFFGFYVLTYLASFLLMLLYFNKFLFKFYNFFFFFFITYLSKIIIEMNLLLFFSRESSISKYITKIVFNELPQSIFISLVGYFVFKNIKSLLKIKKLI